ARHHQVEGGVTGGEALAVLDLEVQVGRHEAGESDGPLGEVDPGPLEGCAQPGGELVGAPAVAATHVQRGTTCAPGAADELGDSVALVQVVGQAVLAQDPVMREAVLVLLQGAATPDLAGVGGAGARCGHRPSLPGAGRRRRPATPLLSSGWRSRRTPSRRRGTRAWSAASSPSRCPAPARRGWTTR